MELNGLWERQNIDEKKMDVIRKDWTEGKVPDLPYMIIDQSNLKHIIGEKLKSIDGARMTTTIIQAQYGDGKTNALKYLKLYFDNHGDLGIHLFYCRANVDQTDFCLLLLQQLQDNCMDELVKGIMNLREIEGFDPSELANGYDEDFSHIREYTQILFKKGQDADIVKNLIYLGTGRLYSKGAFLKYGLSQLTDFNRREVFVLFLNILSKCNYRVVFAVDELEKINDKSTKRMAYFFNSYRELIDLFNKIKGHYLITTITHAIEIASLSQPFWGRIKNDVVVIEKIKREEDLEELVKLMADLLGLAVDSGRVMDIVSKIARNKSLDSNRFVIRAIGDALNNIQPAGFEEELKKDSEVEALYNELLTQVKTDNGVKNLSRILFDPLQYYLEALQYEKVDDNLYRRDYQAFVDTISKRAYFFLFNDDTKIKGRIKEFVENKGITRFVVFVPKELTVTHSLLDIEGIEIKIIDYDPVQLFVLLDIYRRNFDKQDKIFRLIGIVTQQVFE